MKTDLSVYNNDWYKKEINASLFKRTIWFIFNAVVFNSYCFPLSGIKIFLLKVLGAKIGKNVVIKPKVNIKYPWKLSIGDHSWIGENVWIDNLTTVTIGSNVCISQGAMLLTGNHDYSKINFDLIVSAITIEEGAWIGAKSIVCPGVTVRSHAVLAVQSVATRDLDDYGIYQGNPAIKVKDRIIQ